MGYGESDKLKEVWSLLKKHEDEKNGADYTQKRQMGKPNNRVAKSIFSRDGYDLSVYFIAFKMC